MAEPARGEPPHARAGYRRSRELDRELARHYEQCKADTDARFRKNPRRQKQYCAAVAWSRAEKSGRFPDYPTFSHAHREPEPMKRRMPPRNSKGRFVKRSSSAGRTSRRASESPARKRKAPRARAYEESPRRRKPRRAKAASPRKSSRGARRSSGRRSGQTNIAIVPVGVAKESRRGRGRGRGMRGVRRAREPVMAGAGAVTLFVTAVVIGDLIADAVDRYIAGYDPATSPAPTLVAPYTVDNPIPKWNNDAAAMQPGLARIAAQLGPAILFFLLGAVVNKSAALKFFLYGLGGGFTVHAGAQIITSYIIVPMVKGSSSTGARMYQHEINVYNGLANPSGGILGAGPANQRGQGRGLLGAGPGNQPAGAPPQLPANQPVARTPVALASQASPPAAAAAAQPAQQQPPAQQAPAMMGQPPAGGGAHPAGCKCNACPQAPASNGAHPLWSVLLERRAA